MKGKTDFRRRINVLSAWAIAALVVVGLMLIYGTASPPGINDVLSLHIGILQTVATILAIAGSISLLYIQVSVESYSLRASPLLLKEPYFHRLITRYFLVLLALGILALSTRTVPAWMPAMSGALGLLLLIIAIADLFIFLERIVEIVSPEEIINSTRREFLGWQQLRKEAAEKLLPYDWEEAYSRDYRPTVKMPASIDGWSMFEGPARVLIDVITRMILSGDQQAAKKGIEEIANYSGDDLVFPLLETPRELARYKEAAVLAYRSGMLAEIWSVAVRQEDEQSGIMIINAASDLIEGSVLRGSITETDVLKSMFFETLFMGAIDSAWWDARRKVVDFIVSDCESEVERLTRRGYLRRQGAIRHDIFDLCEYEGTTLETEDIPHSMIDAGISTSGPIDLHGHGTHQALDLFDTNLGHLREILLDGICVVILSDEGRRTRQDANLFWRAFMGVTALAKLGVAERNGALLTDISWSIARRISEVQHNDFWSKEVLSRSAIGELIGCIGTNLIGGISANAPHYKSKYYNPVLRAINEYWILSSDREYSDTITSDTAFISSIGSLGRECIQAEMWYELEKTIQYIPLLSKEQKSPYDLHSITAGHVVDTLIRLLHRAIDSTQPEAIKTCLGVIRFYLSDDRPARPQDAVERLRSQLESEGLRKKLESEPDHIDILEEILSLISKG